MASYTLLQFNEHIRRVIALNTPEAVWVQAEIAEADERRGHYYVTLVEKAAQEEHLVAKSQAIFWDKSARKWQRHHKTRLSQLLRQGQAVRLKVLADFHERYGLKLIIEDIDPAFTLGQIALRKQATIATLESKDLLHLNKEKKLPLVPQRLAIISSPTAAGLADFTEQLQQNSYGYQYRTQLFPAAMQGIQSSPEIRRQLKAINRRKNYFDAIVIIRGGGAKTDLADFDDCLLCEAAAQTELPIITGIGHQTDESVLDMVAHTALKTPTAVADFFINKLAVFEQHLLTMGQTIHQLFSQQMTLQKQLLQQIRQGIIHRSHQLTQSSSWQLDLIKNQFKQSTHALLEKNHLLLQNAAKTNKILSLETAQNRGFVWLSKDNKAIRSTQKLKKGEEVIAHFKDGEKTLKVSK